MYSNSGHSYGQRFFDVDSAPSQSQWEVAARQLLDEGQALLAYDVAKSGLEQFHGSFPLTQTAALALIRTGALDEARKLLEPLCPDLRFEPYSLHDVYSDLRSILAPSEASPPGRPDSNTLETLEHLLQSMSRVIANRQPLAAPDEETLGMLARIYKEKWKRSHDLEEARRSRDIYRYSFKMTRGYYTGINAATMSWLIGEQNTAEALAREVYQECEDLRAVKGKDYWLLATMGEAQLILGQAEEALAFYRAAAALAGRKYANVVSSLQQLHLLKEHAFQVPDALFSILKPPNVVVFVGHMIDRNDGATARFPASLEPMVRDAIDRQLDALDAHIGYCSAACGSDILFLEAMQARGAEVNIILPFAKDDFVETCVAFAGERWIIRFENALKLAHSVTYVTEEPLLGDDVLFGFLGQMFHGYADLRARTLLTRPQLLAVWDGNESGPLGGTADLVGRWPDKVHLSVIRIDALLREAIPVSSAGPVSLPMRSNPTPKQPFAYPGRRRIRTLLFADVVGYSKLQEERIPAFVYEFWTQVADHLKPEPLFINSWGDAIFAVMDCALPMVTYALSLQAAVRDTPWAESGLPDGLNIRIGLHAGPIFEGIDPITRRPNYYGAHVNRAARLEPVTVPGHIYASEQFVALLTSEQYTRCDTEEQSVSVVSDPFTCEYIGMLSLAKSFGVQPVYHIRPNR